MILNCNEETYIPVVTPVFEEYQEDPGLEDEFFHSDFKDFVVT